MQNISLKIENDSAERLWSYILAYREMMHSQNAAKKENIPSSATNQIKKSRSKKRA